MRSLQMNEVFANCANCSYCVLTRCRRYPPRVINLGMTTTTIFPMVKDDWLCGEWKGDKPEERR